MVEIRDEVNAAGDRRNKPAESEEDLRAAHLVCVRPTFDLERRLWFVDLDVGDRQRWVRLQLCRYQPHALGGFHASKERASVNLYSTRSSVISARRGVSAIEIALDAIPYSGIQLDGTKNYLEERYVLKSLGEIEDNIYRPTVDELAVLEYKNDPGNIRYVWKMPATRRGTVGIFDKFLEKMEAKIDLGDLR